MLFLAGFPAGPPAARPCRSSGGWRWQGSAGSAEKLPVAVKGGPVSSADTGEPTFPVRHRPNDMVRHLRDHPLDPLVVRLVAVGQHREPVPPGRFRTRQWGLGGGVGSGGAVGRARKGSPGGWPFSPLALTKRGGAAKARACRGRSTTPRSAEWSRCCSSVVERILGKAEVGSSILPGSTIRPRFPIVIGPAPAVFPAKTLINLGVLQSHKMHQALAQR